MSKTLCVIPARLGSSRFPNKPLAPILGMPMLGHVALRCLIEPIFDRVVVATCDRAIMDYCASIGVDGVMTSDRHERASDRAQEAAQTLEAQSGIRFASVTMVQGDEPMTTPTMLRAALEGLTRSGAKVVNLAAPIDDPEEFRSINCVKVVLSSAGDAMFFSRSPIPNAEKAGIALPKAFKQVCVIPFERDYLDRYSATPPTYLEEVESVDMNRVIESGERVHCVEIKERSYPVDVPADLTRVTHWLTQDPLVARYLR